MTDGVLALMTHLSKGLVKTVRLEYGVVTETIGPSLFLGDLSIAATLKKI